MFQLKSVYTIFCVLGALALSASTVFAQYIGPATMPTYRTVADVLNNPVDDAPVALDGYLVKHLRKDKYIFSDGKTEIRTEIDKNLFPPKAISEKTRVQIRGEVEKEFTKTPEIDVNYLVIIE